MYILQRQFLPPSRAMNARLHCLFLLLIVWSSGCERAKEPEFVMPEIDLPEAKVDPYSASGSPLTAGRDTAVDGGTPTSGAGSSSTGRRGINEEDLLALDQSGLGRGEVGLAVVRDWRVTESLDLSGVSLNNHSLAAKQLSRCRKLKSLSLSNSNATDQILMELRTLPSLEKVDVSGLSMTENGINALSRHPNLTSLAVTGVFGPIDWSEVKFSEFPSLERLIVLREQVDSELVTALFDSGKIDLALAILEDFEIAPTPYLEKAFQIASGESRLRLAFALSELSPDVDGLLDTLKQGCASATPAIRVRTVAALGRLGEHAVPLLADSLSDMESDVRSTAVRALRSVGKAAVPALQQALKNDDILVRYHAAFALAELSPETQGLLPVIQSATTHKSPEIVQQAFGAATKLGALSLPLLIDSLNSPQIEIRVATAHALGEIGWDARAAIPLIMRSDLAKESDLLGDQLVKSILVNRIIDDGRDEVRGDIRALGHIDATTRLASVKKIRAYLSYLIYGRPAGVPGGLRDVLEDAVPELKKLLSDEDPLIRQQAALALSVLAPGSEEIVDVLDVMVDDMSPQMRSEAIEALASLGSSAVPTLARALSHEDPKTRVAAASSLRKIGAAAKAAAQHLVDALNDDEFSVRWMSALALSELAPDTEEVLPVVKEGLGQGVDYRLESVRVLGRLGPKAVPILKQVLGNDMAVVRWAAAFRLSDLDPQSSGQVLPILEHALKVGDDAARRTAVHSLAKLGAPAAPILMFAVNDKDLVVSDSAKQRLGAIGAPGVEFVRERLKTETQPLGGRATLVRQFGVLGKSAIPDLMSILEDRKESFVVRLAAVNALEEAGPSSKRVADAFYRASKDDSHDELVRSTAQRIWSAMNQRVLK